MPSDLPAALPALPGLVIREAAPSVSVLRVRDAEAAARRLTESFAMAWPTSPNTISGMAPVVAWLSPGEWALWAPFESVAETVEQACAGLTHHLVDVSAGRRIWRIAGPRSRDLIAKGCSLDTDPRVFGPGQCAQTLLAEVAIFLMPQATEEDGSAFDLMADVSLSGHLRAWFVDAALEYQP